MIASQLGVSRMPIREALYALEFEGFIERLNNRRMRIVGVENGNLQARLNLYSNFENLVAMEIISKDRTEQAVSTLEDILSSELTGEREIEFHTTLFMLTNDRFYFQMYHNLMLPSLKVFYQIYANSGERFEVLNQLASSIKKKNTYEIKSSVDEYYKCFAIT